MGVPLQHREKEDSSLRFQCPSDLLASGALLVPLEDLKHQRMLHNSLIQTETLLRINHGGCSLEH